MPVFQLLFLYNSVVLIFFLFVSRQSLALPEIYLKWVQPLVEKNRFDGHPQERTRPVMLGDIIFSANLNGDVRAMHREKGYRFWQKRMPGAVDGALTYFRSKLFVGDTQGNLISFLARDGSEAWRYKISSEWLSAPTPFQDKIFVSNSNDELFAIHENTGQEVWHYSRSSDEKMTIRGVSSPTVFSQQVIQGFSDGHIVSLNANDGKVMWTQKLRTRDRFYDIEMKPFVDENDIIVGTFDGRLYKLDRLTGKIQWIFNAGSYSEVLVENDKIYLSGLDHHVYAVQKMTGEVIWKVPYEGDLAHSPTRVGKYLVVNASSGINYLIDPELGKIVWSGSFGSGGLSSLVSHADGGFYLLTNYGNLYFLGIRTRIEARAMRVMGLPNALSKHDS